MIRRRLVDEAMKRQEKTPEPSIERLLYDQPGHSIRRLQQIAVSIFLKETSGFSITPDQYAAIAALYVFPGVDQLTLANAIGIDRTTISGLIDRLQAKGLVIRKISEADRRAKLLFLTAAGIRLLANIGGAVDRAQERILSPLSAQERKVFLKTMDRLVSSHNELTRAPIEEVGSMHNAT